MKMTQVEKNAEIVQKIRFLCKTNGISVTSLEKELNFGNGSIGKWAKAPKAPPYDRIFIIAQYFHVTPEEITGENKKPIPEDGQYAQLDSAFFRVLEDAKSKGYTAEDIQLAIDFLDRARRRDQE